MAKDKQNKAATEFPSEKDLDAQAKKATPDSDDAATSDEATAEATPDTQQTAPEAVSETDQLKADLATANQKADDFEDKYLRAEAEIQNMNTRFKKERAQLLKYEGQDLAKDILPVIDNLERALAIDVSDKNGEQLKKGIQMVYDHLERTLKEHQVTEIAAQGVIFDPTIHQAVQTVAVEGDQKPETIVKVLQKGYCLKDRVLRPAMVVVAQ